MKKFNIPLFVIVCFALIALLSSFVTYSDRELPYRKAGLTAEQAAAHLLSRFTYGAKPNEIEGVVKMGLGHWFEQQLTGEMNDVELNRTLVRFDDINLSNADVEKIYPRNAQLVRFAVRDGYLHKDSVGNAQRKSYRDAIQSYMAAKGYKSQNELFRMFINQKITRAIYTENQLREVMTDFWFNHFNVSLTKNQCAAYVPAYERDIIRPQALGNFESLLLATAKSPAMLLYLDNFTSSGTNEPLQGMEVRGEKAGKKFQKNKRAIAQAKPAAQKKSGLNENYAREVMELHTLGVDGGYTQSDVTQAARILTGWTLAPLSDYGYGTQMKAVINRIGIANLEQRGFKLEGDFLFAMNRHDNGEKKVLGHTFPAGGGYEEGVTLLKMLASHTSTAKFISKKIAIRFVSDNPPQSLIDKMAKTFLNSKGDIKEVLRTLVYSPEFWAKESLREKMKSPFELAISAVRSLDAKVLQPFQLNNWITKMGQQMYYYQAPTGFPDRGQYWINTGSLLSRMNFGLALAMKRIPGVSFDLNVLNKNREPESIDDALMTYGKLMLPERNLEATLGRLKPLIANPDLERKVANAANQNAATNKEAGMMTEMQKEQELSTTAKTDQNKFVKTTPQNAPSVLAQVVGVIIGSPEFQRR